MPEASDQARSAASEIADALAQAIRCGAIAIDSPIPTERELCERFGASRPTVREALISLQMRGFISSGNGRRPRAARPSLVAILRGASEHLRDILGDTETSAYLEQMRQFIEAGAAREAAGRANSVQVANLRDALARNRVAIGTESFPDTDIAFHQALVAVVGNPVLQALHQMFVSEILRMRPNGADRVAADTQSFEEHRKVYEAILDGDAPRATGLLDSHLARSFRMRLAIRTTN